MSSPHQTDGKQPEPAPNAELDFRSLFENAPNLYLVLLPDLTIVGMNDAYAAATLIERDKVIGRNLFDVFPDNPEDPAADGVSNLRASLNHVLRTGQAHAMAVQKYDIRRPDGSFEVRYWSPLNKPVVTVAGAITYIVHRVDDVTAYMAMQEQQARSERKAVELETELARMGSGLIQRSKEIQALNHDLERRVAERTHELQRTEQRYHAVLNTLLDSVVILDHNWRYIYVNPAAEERSGLTRIELMARPIQELFPDIARTGLFQAMQRTMASRAPEKLETDFVYPDGRRLHLSVNVQPTPEGIFVHSADITHRKLTERTLAKQQRELEAQNKELTQFAFVASHDLQEPLRTVASFVELLRKRYSDKLGPEAQEYIDYAVSGATHMRQLVDDLLTYSRVGRTLENTDVDLNMVLDQVLFNLRVAITESGCKLMREKLPTIRAVETEMVQLFQNILANAIKFRKPGVPPQVRISCRGEAAHWQFAVEDNGIGINPAHHDLVFVPFKRLNHRSEYTGSGVGLAVAQKVVHRYGGHIWFDAVPSGGTIFHFTLNN